MKWAWGMVAGLYVLAGCGPENVPVTGTGETEASPPSTQRVSPITVEPASVTFPDTSVAQAATSSVLLHNTGQSLARVLLGIPEPFSVALTVVNLQPGEQQAVDLSLYPAQPGIATTVLVVQTEDQRLEIPVNGKVEPATDTGSTSPSLIEARN